MLRLIIECRIEPDSSTLQYFDEDNITRAFSSLSSGEREVIVLAFDILMQHPSDCIILIDEPEIHLHPELTYRLIKVLKHIGERNQFFLFTHSTDIISNSFETGIHFIRPKSVTGNDNQTLRIDMNNLADLMNLPNLREAIGMLSLGKKLLFVEGINNSIDRNVFATMAKSSKNDLAIVPSESCDNINNLSSIADTLHKGIFGIDLYMVRDRDSLTDEEVKTYTEKSKGKLIFLPYYHIENAFLSPEAIFSIAQINDSAQKKSLDEIKKKLTELAQLQLNKITIRYVANEIRFKAGNLDITPILDHDITTKEEIIKEMNKTKQEKLQKYSEIFSDEFIKLRIEFWNTKLQDSIKDGWTEEARKLFYGKSILSQIQQWIFPGKHVILWEQIINSNDVNCVNAVTALKTIIDSFNNKTDLKIT